MTEQQTRIFDLKKTDAKNARVPFVVVDVRHLSEKDAERWLAFDGYLNKALAELAAAERETLCTVCTLRPNE